MAGLTDTGFEIPLLEDLLEEVATTQKTNIDANLNTEADSVLGNLNAIFLAKLHAAWEQMQVTYQSAYPDTSSGVPLSYISAITGTIRQPATKGTVTATVTLDASTYLPAGSGASVDGEPTMQFVTIADFTAPGTPPSDDYEVAMEAVVTGATTFANSGQLTVIDTPVSGWTAVTNAAASLLGTGIETDAELRIRREEELARPGTGTIPAIIVDMEEVDGVIDASVFENTNSYTDSDGLPPHSIEIVMLLEAGVVPQDLHDRILEVKPAGTYTYGSTAGTADDIAGNTHYTAYSEAVEVRTYIVLTLTSDPEFYTDDTTIEEAIETWGIANLGIGEDVFASDLICVVNQQPGVVSVDVSTVRIDKIATPASVDLVIDSREIATIATADVTVTSS